MAAAAYRSADEMVDERTGVVHDYTRKRGVVSTEILMPGGGSADRATLWNGAEAAEKRKDARTGRDWTIALPDELNAGQRRALARSFAEALAERYGVAVDMAIHLPDRGGDNRNHHAHLLTTTRLVSRASDGSLVFGEKAGIELCDKDRLARGLNRGAEELTTVRALWEKLANSALEGAGRTERIDARSLQAQGIDREPTVHLGPVASDMERRGIPSSRGEDNRQVRENNRQRAQLSAQIISLEDERERRERVRVATLSVPEIRNEIARIRPKPITQRELFAASPKYVGANAKTNALLLAVDARKQERDIARSEAIMAQEQMLAWRAEHPVLAKLHQSKRWPPQMRWPGLSALEKRVEMASKQAFHAEKRRAVLSLRAEQLGKMELAERVQAINIVEKRRAPILNRIEHFESVALEKKRGRGQGI